MQVNSEAGLVLARAAREILATDPNGSILSALSVHIEGDGGKMAVMILKDGGSCAAQREVFDASQKWLGVAGADEPNPGIIKVDGWPPIVAAPSDGGFILLARFPGFQKHPGDFWLTVGSARFVFFDESPDPSCRGRDRQAVEDKAPGGYWQVALTADSYGRGVGSTFQEAINDAAALALGAP